MAVCCSLEDVPDELLVAILSLLPWNEVLRLRMICMKWNELLRSSEFRRGWRGRDSSQPPLCFIGCKDFGHSVYNPCKDGWQVCGSDYPPSFFMFTNKCGDSYRSTDVRVVGAAHGLLLLQVFIHVKVNRSNPVKIELFVMNPLDPSTKKRIPLPSQLDDHFTTKPLGMAWNSVTQSHQILLQYRPEMYLDPDDDSNMWIFYSYDLQRDVWVQIARWPGEKFLVFQHPSLKKGRLCCLGREALSIMPNKFRPYSLDSSERNWLREPTWIVDDNPSFPQIIQFATLFHNDQGSLFAAGKVQMKHVDFVNCSVLQEFGVWKLQAGKLAKDSKKYVDEWVKLYDMPESIVEKINDSKSRKQFQCAATDKFVCVANSTRDGAMFDITNNLWWRLPTHPLNYSTDLPGHDQRVLNWLDLRNLDLHLCEPRFDILL